MRESNGRLTKIALAVAAIALTAGSARASVLTVGEFRWDTQSQLGGPCALDDAECLSIFSLTNLLGDPGPALTGVLSLDGAEAATLGPVPTGALNYEQFGPVVPGPGVASLLVTLTYQGMDRDLSASLSAPGSQTLFLETGQAPEPASVVLLVAGVGAAFARLRRRHQVSEGAF